jgi:hypothetical protein
MTIDEALQKALKQVDVILSDRLAEFISTLHCIADPTEAEIAELERQQAAERTRVEPRVARVAGAWVRGAAVTFLTTQRAARRSSTRCRSNGDLNPGNAGGQRC